jgi:hypothetical protein
MTTPTVTEIRRNGYPVGEHAAVDGRAPGWRVGLVSVRPQTQDTPRHLALDPSRKAMT